MSLSSEEERGRWDHAPSITCSRSKVIPLFSLILFAKVWYTPMSVEQKRREEKERRKKKVSICMEVRRGERVRREVQNR